MKLLAVFLLVSSVVVQASANPCFGSIQTLVSCPSGWTLINNRCFLYVPTEMTWTNAEKNCLSMGTNLASVHNMNEYRQVQNLISAAGYGSKQAWLGGSDGQQEKTWFWSDGSPMTYTNWCLKQPDNKGGKQNCLQMNYPAAKCWDDVECHIRRPSVCAKKG
ncbi:type-2 ice-structuring protein-like [Xiphophorus maculatus]|nr:type-2 ice-structuring protein-like [Xiphophorus maculatus]XP_023201665.1 type-2 ice-structuring protein-like [Xiphophorus maculatus]